MIFVQMLGGLGNQMFEYACARKIAHETGDIIKLDLSLYIDREVLNIFKLNRFNTNFAIASEEEIFKVKNEIPSSLISKLIAKINLPETTYSKSSHLKCREFHTPIRVKKKVDDIYLEGYWADPFYFHGIEEIIREEYRLKDELTPSNMEVAHLINCCDSISVHIRRGDYLAKNQFFHSLTLDYYKTAIKWFNEKLMDPKYFFFSDDINWVRENFNIKNSNYVDINLADEEYYDLYLMSLCKHNIIANSTFSWWGAWLNNHPDKIVIAPQKWYNNQIAQNYYESSKSFIPEAWIKI